MRKDNLNSKRGAAVLDPEDRDGALKDFYRPSAGAAQRVLAGGGRPTPIEFPVGFPDETEGEPSGGGQFLRNQRRASVRKSWIPQSRFGRILLGVAAVGLLGAAAACVAMARSFLLHDPRFRIESSSSIQIVGNSHVTRPELLGIFGEDIGRNMFYVPLAQRRSELEALPWVERATVMRLLPDRLRVSVAERTPVAFVRQGGRIGLVDAHGVLLEMAAEGGARPAQNYSFPVVVGISAAEPLSTREARMKIFGRFTADLDATGEHISRQLSEVDLSEPEDVRALVFDKDADVLVHFGDVDFLERYRSFEAHLAEWRQQYPKLASVDMRYPRQVVLEMQAGTGVPVANAADGAAAAPAEQSTAVPGAAASAAPTAPHESAAQSASTVAATHQAAPKSVAASPRGASAGDAPTAHAAANSPQAGAAAKTASVAPKVDASAAGDAKLKASIPTLKSVQLNAKAGASGDALQAADASLGRQAPSRRGAASAAATRNATSAAGATTTAGQPAALAQPKDGSAAETFNWIPKPAGRNAAGKHSAAHPMPTNAHPSATTTQPAANRQQTSAAGQAQ